MIFLTTTLQKELKKLDKEYNTEDLKKLPEYKLKVIELNKKYNNISDYEYELEKLKVLNREKTDKELKVMELDLMLKYKRIDPVEYCKKKYDILEKPWYSYTMNCDEENGYEEPRVEMVYNQTFIKVLKDKGYFGDSDEEVIESYLKQLYASQIKDEITDYIDDQEEQTHIKTPIRADIGNNRKIVG